jgi:outer membrane biosynthesis protein TonB
MKRHMMQTDQTPKPGPGPLAHFFIYENLNYVADSKISKEQITIGRSHNADVVLNHSSVADIHAFIHFEGRQAFLTNRYPDDGLHLNGKTVHLAELQHEDVIDIGPFALKIKIDGISRSNASAAATYCVALVNRYTSDDDMQTAAQTLAKQFKADPVKMALIVAKPEFTLKKDLNKADAERWQIALQKAGIFCEMRVMKSQSRTRVREVWSSPPDVSEKPADTADPVAVTQVVKTPYVEPGAAAPVHPEKASQDTAKVPEPHEPATATPTRACSAQTKPAQSQPAAVEELPKKETSTVDGTDAPDPSQVHAATFPASAKPIQTQEQQPAAEPSVEVRAAESEERPVDAAPDPRITQSHQVASSGGAMFQWDAHEEEEDEEDLWQAPFSLKEKLAEIRPARPTAMPLDAHVQVVKTIGDRVVDVRYLAKGQSYIVTTDAGKRCLARNKGKKNGYVCFAQDAGGYVNNAKGETVADLNSYKRSDYLFKKRKRIYRIPIPGSGEVNVQEGRSHYRIVMAHPTQSPTVRVVERPPDFTWRHWAISAGTHVFLVLCLSIYWYFQAITPSVSPPHFVKIDPAILQQLQPKKLPEPPKQAPPEPEPPKPEPVKVAKKLEPPKKAPKKRQAKPVAKPVKTKRKVKTVAKARPSRHPKAGGGFGKDNIKNRNINQTGLLSVLGKTPLSGPSTAVASVTNLDAVPVPGATDKNFSVGGVKGSLGNGKISVAGGEMLQTKSSEQVFRSAGASGPGNVAALQRGNTGKKQVQGMVTAKMSRTVKIRGGMSREMVKRVIDQHLQEITYCYETALMANPSIMGRIVFEWKILMSGQVGQVRVVASSVNSHEVHNCIKAAIKSWQFPKPVGAEVIVSYPFVFDLVAF